MHHFRGMMDCHRRLLSAAEALREEIDGHEVTPRLLRLRYEMAIVARDNLTATQRLWSRIEREVPDIERHIRNYGRLKAVESDLHVRYANHIAAWPVGAISSDFAAFARTKRQFLGDLRDHTRRLEIELFEPACRILDRAAVRKARVA